VISFDQDSVFSDYTESELEYTKKVVEDLDLDESDSGFEDREMYLGDFDYIPFLEDSIIQETSLEELEKSFNFHKLSAEAQGFYKVFIEGKVEENRILKNIQLSESFLKLLFPPPLDIVVKNRLPSYITLIGSVTKESKLKPIENNFQELSESIEYQAKWILQNTSCQKINGFKKCLNCQANEPDYCRFQGIRALAYDAKRNVLKTAPRWQEYTEANVDYPIFSSVKLDDEEDEEDEELLSVLNVYKEINETLPDIPLIPLPDIDDSIKFQYKRYLLCQSSDSLLRLLSLQLSLFKYTKLYLKKHNKPYHHQCDNCKDTLINIYYLNKHCGVEICYRCYLKGDLSNLKTECLEEYSHPMTDFIPVTLYKRGTFQRLLNNCNEFIKTQKQNFPYINDRLFVYNGADSKTEPLQRNFKSYVRGTEQEVGLENYQSLMQQGIPFVIQNISEDYMQNFTHKNLVSYYGEVYVDQILSNSPYPTEVQLKEFLKYFDNHKKCSSFIKSRKIIDWPVFSDFDVVFPKLYNAFLNMLPFKQCTHPNGMLNLTSYLPKALYPPDLGPKLYISTGKSRKNPGTTRLGLESTDTIYIMTQRFISGNEFSTVRCAAIWHIFDNTDTDKIRKYLSFHPKYFSENYVDLIYDRPVYLTPKMLEELKEEYNVTGYQIYQNPGDCVFIPAGCAYQIHANSNCIQISTGYIGPETTEQCLNITQELSQLPGTHPRNGDFAQVANHILYSTSDAMSCLLSDKDSLLSYTFPQASEVDESQDQSPKRRKI
jgi:hypothetical protein